MMLLQIKNWIRCNILNRHHYGWCGDRDLYDNPYWHCSWCDRVRYKDYDEKRVQKKRKEIHSQFSK